MITDETRLRLAGDATHQSLGSGEDTVILSLKSGHLYTCNETTAAFLRALEARPTLAEAVDRLFEQFDVPRNRLRQDLATIAERLIAEGIVETA
jgi:hypothetical protein